MWPAVTDAGEVHALRAGPLQRGAKARERDADRSRFLRLKLSEAGNVATGGHQQMPEVRRRPVGHRRHMESDYMLVVHQKASGDGHNSILLPTDQAIGTHRLILRSFSSAEVAAGLRTSGKGTCDAIPASR